MSTEMSKQMSSSNVIITTKTAVDAILRSAVAPANEHHRVTVQALGKRFTPSFFPSFTNFVSMSSTVIIYSLSLLAAVPPFHLFF